jgi:ATP-dependent Clp protease ATP-binding subunit ClpC
VAASALESLGISLEAVRQQVAEILGHDQQARPGHIPFTPHAKKVLELSLRESLRLGHNYIGTEHILLGLLREVTDTKVEGPGVAAQVLVNLGADLRRVRQRVIRLLHDRGQERAAAGPPPRKAPPGTAPSSSPLLDQFGRNLTAAAREGSLDPVIGREKEIERVMQVLSRRSKNSPVLVGEPGVGKTAVVEGLAQQIASGEVPGTFAARQLYALDLGAVAAASGNQADFAARLTAILAESRTRGDIILFFDDLHAQLGTGEAGQRPDAAPVLSPLLARGALQAIAAATPAGYRACLQADAVFERTFQPVQVAEPAIPQTIEILSGVRRRYEAHHHVTITDDALVAAAQPAGRSLPGRSMPGKAIELIDEAASAVSIRRQAGSAGLPAEVNSGLIAETLAVMSAAAAPPTVSGRPDQLDPPFRPAAKTDDDRAIWAMA